MHGRYESHILFISFHICMLLLWIQFSPTNHMTELHDSMTKDQHMTSCDLATPASRNFLFQLEDPELWSIQNDIMLLGSNQSEALCTSSSYLLLSTNRNSSRYWIRSYPLSLTSIRDTAWSAQLQTAKAHISHISTTNFFGTKLSPETDSAGSKTSKTTFNLIFLQLLGDCQNFKSNHQYCIPNLGTVAEEFSGTGSVLPN